MTIRELYERVGGNYEDAMTRLMNESIARRVLSKFPDADDYRLMADAFERGDYEEAFLRSHTLKGTALNLGLNRLGQTASDLCETVRSGQAPDPYPSGLLAQAKEEYGIAVDAIRSLDPR